MKLKDTFVTQEMDGEQVMVEADGGFAGMVRSNATAAFIIDQLKTETTKEAILDAMCKKYDAPRAVMAEDVDMVINNLKKIGDYAFQNVKTATFTANNLEEIGIGAFQFAENLSEFVFSRAINKVGTAAFYGSLSLKTFAYYDGVEKKTDGKINDYALLYDGVLYTKMPSGKLQLASVPAAKFTKTFVIRDDAEKVDAFAGNQNVNIEKIVFPDVMKTIGANAFIGYTALKTVEFRSFTAPTLEDFYTKSASLSENDPGYEILHNQMGIFSLELYYYNFVDLVGKRKPIEMILPANADVEGYDSIVYLVYFGSVADADRSDYVAQSKHLIRFFDYATKIQRNQPEPRGLRLRRSGMEPSCWSREIGKSASESNQTGKRKQERSGYSETHQRTARNVQSI